MDQAKRPDIAVVILALDRRKKLAHLRAAWKGNAHEPAIRNVSFYEPLGLAKKLG